ncbi:SigE family RNA polymerase sigma factor [Dactylosporangium fulvum]|uniref:SigE family RNA polymerase sigma factor n=1 Tax=Dactylosporangium fulvum TaxID=53359 RepID=A0ABY5WB84_9ACTN|nr:SigE family RNA polymerase sigma factor [Dactylosporangium fulvum]UWP87322.1 SigE family RNA polymerase sigma factor [Dactylosporangium fulvum]
MDSLADEFGDFVRSRTPSLLRSAFLLTGDQHLAEDLVQNALIRTHQAWRRLHHTGNAEAYTRKIMYHLQVAWWRRGKVVESLTEDVTETLRGTRRDASDTGDHATATAVRVTLQAALLRLTNRQRAVLVLRFFEDRSEVAAAELMGVSVGTIKSQTAKALARLRTIAPELNELYFTGVAR